MKKEKTKRKVKFPILAKTAVIIFVLAFFIVETAMTYYALVLSNKNKEMYANYADSLASTISEVVDLNDYNTVKDKVKNILISIPEEERYVSDDPDESKIDAYLAHYDSLWEDNEFTTTFNKIRDNLRKIEAANAKLDVSSIYLIYLYQFEDAQGQQQGLFVYLVDSAEEADACPPGWIDPLYDFNRHILDDETAGFPAYITNTEEYGYLTTAGSYIEGSEKGYGCIDISMTAVRAKQASSIVRLFIYLTSTVLLIGGIAELIIYLVFNRPVKRLRDVATSYDNNDPEKTHDNFVNLQVKTRDEIEDLAETIKVMENGIHERINQLLETNRKLLDSKEETAKMTVLANRDALTGVKSKVAYNIEVEAINEQLSNKKSLEFGIAMIDLNYLKITNDEYGHVAGDEALIRLSNTICLVFKRSPVFRIGGDEFVVILKNSDYRNSAALIEEFKERILDITSNKKLDDYERISAAIGYAEYDPKVDNTYDDVFKRADKSMYDNKRFMKEKK